MKTVEINTADMLERLHAYRRPNNHIDANMLLLDIVALMKWSNIPPDQFLGEFKYQWDRVHFDPTFKPN